LQKHTWRIRLQNTSFYARDFLHSAHTGTDNKVVTVDLTDEVEGGVYALIKFCKTHRYVRIEVTSDAWRYISPFAPRSNDTYVSKLQALFHRLTAAPVTAEDRTWSIFFENSVTEVIIAFQHWSTTPYVRLAFRPRETAWWHGASSVDKERHVPAWVMKTGCPIDKPLAVLELSGAELGRPW
jgi:hypothetical protein